MTSARGARERVHEPRPRFRCLVCRVFVVGTELGHCPRCGWLPPAVRPLRTERPRARLGWLAVVVTAALALAALAALASR